MAVKTKCTYQNHTVGGEELFCGNLEAATHVRRSIKWLILTWTKTLKLRTHKRLIKTNLSIDFDWNPMKLYGIMTNYLHKIHRVSLLQGKPLERMSWNLACRWNNHLKYAFLWFDRNQDKVQIDMTQTSTRVKITQSNFVNKRSISYQAYQANCLEEWTENRSAIGIIITESSCSSFSKS